MERSEAFPNPLELRTRSYRYLELAKGEADPQMKRGLTSCAYAMSQFAECIELEALSALQR